MAFPVPIALRLGLSHMAVLLSMRLLPFAVYRVVMPSTPLPRKLVAAVGYLAFPLLAYHLGAGSTLLYLAAGLGYYAIVSFGVNRLSAWMAAKRLTRGAALFLIFFVFLLLPGVAAPNVALTTFLVVGCELGLSAYSYCVETSRPGTARASMRECLFFLFVNPTVVYIDRGAPVASGGPRRGLMRVIGGATIMFLNVAMLRPLAAALQHREGSSWLSTHAGQTAVLFYGIVRLLTLYAAHSGLASIQIGMMRQIGWTVPERYRYPLFAKSPIEFWRRWNTYVRVWLEVYVFLPIAKQVARRNLGRSGQVAAGVATLVASGVLHGAVIFAGRQNLSDLTVDAEFFLAAGVLLAGWRLGGLLGSAIRARLDARMFRSFDFFIRLSGRLSLAGAIVAAAASWG